MAKFVRKCLLWLGLAIACWMLLLGLTAALGLTQWIPNLVDRRGGYGFTLRRLAEARAAEHADVVILGSSHAYRGFDPRIFASVGIDAFNLGTSSQTPLNSFFLARRFLPELRAKVVAVEVYWEPIQDSQGLESTLDLVCNSEASLESVAMAFASRHPLALNTVVADYTRRIWSPLDVSAQRGFENDRYVGRGYVETSRAGFDATNLRDANQPLSNLQIAFLRLTVEYAASLGSKVLLVRAPVSSKYLASIGNYAALTTAVEDVATELGVPFWDFNGQMDLSDRVAFVDADHLSQAGVAVFNRLLLQRMESSGFLNVQQHVPPSKL